MPISSLKTVLDQFSGAGKIVSTIALSSMLVLTVNAEVSVRTANNGNLVMEDIPPIPESIVQDLNRFQNVRSAPFREWTRDGESVYISTRFGDVSQLHRVDDPLGARKQLTFFKEPIGSVSRQPGGDLISFTMDAGGSENAQVFILDPATGESRMISDGESRNGGVSWRRDGKVVAYQSTRRNGAANDLWMTDIADPDSSKLIMESPDGSWWGASDWNQDGSKILVQQYISITDSRIHMLDVESGELTLLQGSAEAPSVNYSVAFSKDDDGYYFLTDQNDEFAKLAFQKFGEDSYQVITKDIPWGVENVGVNEDRSRMVFAVNADGMSEVYLLNPKTFKYSKVSNLPVGQVGGLEFSPDSKRLALTLNTAKSPSDTFVLELRSNKLRHGYLTRWTESEVGGLDTSKFAEPELFKYPTFDQVDGADRMIPAFIFRPPAAKQPSPVIISIHGGPEGQYRPGFSSTFQLWISKLGAAVIAPNVRGSSGYGREYVSLDNGFKREDSVKDIGALLDWIETQPDLDAERVVVIGGSYGGYMVLASSVMYSDRLKAAVDIVGISNFVTFLKNTKDYRRDLRRAEYGDERDPAMRAHQEKISPNNNVSKIKVPMFVVQGQNDPRVPVTEAEQIVEALRLQGNEVWYMNALNEGHGYRKKENRDIYQQAVVMFIKQHLELE